MLDKLPPWARHFAIILAVSLLTIAADKIPAIADQLPAGVAPLLATVVSAALLALTPLTKQYGVGADPTAVETVDPVEPDPAAVDVADELSAEPLNDPVSSQTDPGSPDTTDIPNREGDF